MPFADRSRTRRYAFTLLVVAAALLLRWVLWPVLGPEVPFLFLWPAVLSAAWYGGLGPGLLATLLAALSEDLILLGPGSIATGTRQELWGLVLFLLLGSSLSVLLDRLHRARQQADSHREWLRTTLHSIGDAVIATDRQGRVTLLNPVAQGLTGWKEEEAVGRPLPEVFRIVNEHTRQPAACPVRRVLETGGIVGLANHTTLIARHGTESPIDDSAAPIRDARGTVRGVVLVFRDVTERRRLEHALQRRADELAEADRHKNEFLAMLGHELRNPLAPIHNAVALLALKGPAHADLQWARGVIDRQVRHLARLVDDLLDVSRISRGKIRLQKRPVELAAVIEQAVETARPLLEERKHELVERLPGEPVWLDADPVRLAQVIANLLTNAAKYTDLRGRVELIAERDGDTVVARVRDTGIGIAPDMLPRVFDLFTQADRALDRAEGGLGIGLTLVRNLVELHGGTVEARSEGLGRGSEFVVRLPARQGPPGDVAGTAAAVAADGSPRRVLLVDDRTDSVESLALLLAHLGHDVRTAADGPTALEAARTFRPEVVLLDIGLPGMDGYEVARRLRRDPDTEDALVVALTGHGQDEDRRRAREAGFDQYLTKPVGLAEVQAVVAGRQAVAR